MKKDIHPDSRYVVFRDVEADFQIITKSTITTSDKIDVDGVEYPLIKLDISSASHPFYTGKQKIVDTAGRVERFQRRYQRTSS